MGGITKVKLWRAFLGIIAGVGFAFWPLLAGSLILLVSDISYLDKGIHCAVTKAGLGLGFTIWPFMVVALIVAIPYSIASFVERESLSRVNKVFIWLGGCTILFSVLPYLLEGNTPCATMM